MSNALQAAVGQWLQVDFDHPVTNATLTLTPARATIGAQVDRIEVSTANGTTTVMVDQPGKPLTAALPYGETPWVRITAARTADGSSGVQFGITDLAITQYDAVRLSPIRSTCATPCWCRARRWARRSRSGTWARTLLGRPGCIGRPTACTARRRWRWRPRSRSTSAGR